MSMRVRLENTKFPCLRATRASLEAAAGLPSAGRDCYHAPLTQPSENGRRDRLLEARDRLDALESRWRSRHPAALQRAERFVRMMQGLASPPVESPSGQRPDLFRFPGLTARPWYEPGEFPWVPILERGWTEVRAEVDALLARPGAFRPFLDGEGAAYREEKFALGERRDSWTVCDLLSEEGARVCPRSLEPGGQALDEPMLAQFSLLRPGAHLPAHCGLANFLLTVHLGIHVPPGCAIRVGSETRSWTEGGCLVFDDSFEHEVWQRGERDRIVLIARFWHPDLTPVEIDALTDVLQDVAPLLGDSAGERKAGLEQLRPPPR